MMYTFVTLKTSSAIPFVILFGKTIYKLKSGTLQINICLKLKPSFFENIKFVKTGGV